MQEKVSFILIEKEMPRAEFVAKAISMIGFSIHLIGSCWGLEDGRWWALRSLPPYIEKDGQVILFSSTVFYIFFFPL